ncbi:methylmalonyl-CoA mutase family protein [Metabacillus halosaccharovorans]|uniref:methylmalonyl-CoA mutase family protein n=1 Tax=Metabacillus halosaccharovorans TaxID=930124 RepID=UPI0034CD6F22
MEEEQITSVTREKHKAWKKEVEKSLRGKPIENLIKISDEGISIKTLYDELDLEHNVISRTNLIRKDHQLKISQLISAKDPQDLKEKIIYAKKRGQHSFYMTNIDYLERDQDIVDAFSSINWTEDVVFIDVGENIGFTPLFFLHQKMQHQFKRVVGTISFDPYEELLLEGVSKVSLGTKMDFLADTIKWSAANEGHVRCLLIKGNIYSEAGANALQELVFTFSQAIDLINELTNRGISFESIENSLTISLGVGSNFFMEIAKLRAARNIWASIVQAFGGNAQELKVNLHAITTTFNKTAFDAHVNLLRTTTESFSAVLAGVNEITIIPFDHVLNQSSILAERIARNTYFILNEESLLSKVVDPSAGSYYVETITKQLGMEAWEKIKEIEQDGGFLPQLEQGTIQHELEKMREKRMAVVNNRDKLVIGTNTYALTNEKVTIRKEEKGEKPNNLTEINPSFQEALTYIGKEKRVPTIKGDNQKEKLHIIPIQCQRLVEHFERLRFQAEKAKEKGRFVKVGIITFGKLKDYKPSLDHISGILAAGGIEIELTSWDDLRALPNLQVVILCGKKEDVQVVDSAYIQQLRKDNPSLYIYIMGNEKEMTDNLNLSGVISLHEDIYQFLLNIHNILGVSKE